MQELAKKVKIKGLTAPELSRCIQFYHVYPQILGTLSQKFGDLLPISNLGMTSQDLKINDNQNNTIYFEKLVTKISYSNFIEIIKIKNETKRKFYELLVIKNTLSNEELKKQIATLAYERVGSSQNMELAFAELSNKITPQEPSDAIKSIYLFDFLKLPNAQLIEESELEDALLNHLQAFMLELGYGFCFEARQKKILIDEEYYFVDLVFYHKILKCNVLGELKTDIFKPEYASKLNTYVAYYNDQEKREDDNRVRFKICNEFTQFSDEAEYDTIDNLLEMMKIEQKIDGSGVISNESNLQLLSNQIANLAILNSELFAKTGLKSPTKPTNESSVVDAIIYYIQTMDIEMLDLFLPDIVSKNFNKSKFIGLLANVFNELKSTDDKFLYIALGKCNVCNKSKSGYGFIGNSSGIFFTLIFDIKNNKITDLYECSNFEIITKLIKLNERVFIDIDLAGSDIPF